MPDNTAVPPAQPPQSPPPTPPANESQARTWNMLCHLSALAGLLVPFGTIIGPLLVWQIKKNEFPSVDAHGKAALNFQLTVLIGILVAVVAGFVLSFACIGVLFFPVAGVMFLGGLVLAAIAGIRANNGEAYRYPWSLTFVR